MQIDHIIVQAGGKGTRLEHLTANKPKALVPVENLPMLKPDPALLEQPLYH